MQTREFLDLLHERYSLRLTPDDLVGYYLAKGLLPAPDPIHGFVTLSAPMLMASRHCIEHRMSLERIANAVSLVGFNMTEGDPFSFVLYNVHNALHPDNADKQCYWSQRLNDAFRWGMAVLKAQLGLPQDQPVSIAETSKVVSGGGEDWTAEVSYAIEPETKGKHGPIDVVRHAGRPAVQFTGEHVWISRWLGVDG